MRRFATGIAASAALAGGLLLAAPAAAQAAPAESATNITSTSTSAEPTASCAAKSVCLYTKKKLKGGKAWFEKGTHDLGEYGLDNKASSTWNRTGKTVRVWTKTNYKGKCGIIPKGAKVDIKKSWDNKVSSLKVGGSC